MDLKNGRDRREGRNGGGRSCWERTLWEGWDHHDGWMDGGWPSGPGVWVWLGWRAMAMAVFWVPGGCMGCGLQVALWLCSGGRRRRRPGSLGVGAAALCTVLSGAQSCLC